MNMGKHFSDDLYECRHVMSSDEDLPIVMDIYVGFSQWDELTVSVELSDYEEPWRNCSTAAVVNVDDAHRMAARHGIDYERLPQFIAECMADWRKLINPRFGKVKDCFKEITECLLDEGCRFRIERTCGRGGRICC